MQFHVLDGSNAGGSRIEWMQVYWWAEMNFTPCNLSVAYLQRMQVGGGFIPVSEGYTNWCVGRASYYSRS
jgi:hypothetical protein